MPNNSQLKLIDNQYKNLIKSYRYRSFVVGKNVQIISDTFSLSGDEVKVFFNKDLYDITTIYADGKVILNADANGIKAIGNSMEIYLIDQKIILCTMLKRKTVKNGKKN